MDKMTSKGSMKCKESETCGKTTGKDWFQGYQETGKVV